MLNHTITSRFTGFQRACSGFLCCCLLAFSILSTGCASIISGTSKDVVFLVNPPGETVYYEGRAISDGETVRISKSLSSNNRVNVGTRERPRDVEFNREVDPWFIGSVALIIIFLVPGVVAIAVDFVTGAALEPTNTQNFNAGA